MMPSCKDDTNRVRAFFDRNAAYCDSYYNARKPFFRGVLDRIFRHSVTRRLELTEYECRSFREPVSILDVGCGSGRSAVALARHSSVSRVTGIDFSQTMIASAICCARTHNLEEKCSFIHGDLADIQLSEKYDVTVALGFFDYTHDAISLLAKIKSVTTKKIIASFPAKWRARNLVRVVRLAALDCPVYFYTRKDVERIFREASVEIYSITSLGRDYFVVARA